VPVGNLFNLSRLGCPHLSPAGGLAEELRQSFQSTRGMAFLLAFSLVVMLFQKRDRVAEEGVVAAA
jgi:hypothetical protein